MLRPSSCATWEPAPDAAVAGLHHAAADRRRLRRRRRHAALPALTLRLEPFPAEEARKLALAAAGDRRLTDEELGALMERGAGNPLFLQRLASVGEASEEAQELPETVEALVATRIDQLAPGRSCTTSVGIRARRVVFRHAHPGRPRG